MRVFEAIVKNPEIVAYVDILYAIEKNCEINFLHKVLFEES